MSSPEDLHGAPQVEHHEDDGLVLHLLQAAEDDEQNDVPGGQLQRPRAERQQGRYSNVQTISESRAAEFKHVQVGTCASWHLETLMWDQTINIWCVHAGRAKPAYDWWR